MHSEATSVGIAPVSAPPSASKGERVRYFARAQNYETEAEQCGLLLAIISKQHLRNADQEFL
jgi:hypothetical protein